MKLKIKQNVTPPRTEKVKLDGDKAALLDLYAQYYKSIYKAEIATSDLLAEMANEFMKSDRGFTKWRNQQDNSKPTE